MAKATVSKVTEGNKTIPVKNSTLVSQKFVEVLDKICNMVFGREQDEKLFLLMDALNVKQIPLKKYLKKYGESTGLNKMLEATNKTEIESNNKIIEAYNKLAEPLLEEVSQVEFDEVLVLQSSKEFTATDRFILREVVKFEFKSDPKP